MSPADGLMVTSSGSFFVLIFFSPRVRGKLLDTSERVGCSCLVHFGFVGPSFWIDAHIALVVHFEVELIFSVGARSAAGHLGDERRLLPRAFLLCGTFILD